MPDVIIQQGAGFTIAQTDVAETAVPYRPIPRQDAPSNYGFVDLRDNLGAISSIPEAFGVPGMEAILRSLNDTNSPFMSLGCERGFFPASDKSSSCYYGSYVAMAYRESAKNSDPGTFINLAKEILSGIESSELYTASFEMLIEPLVIFFGDRNRYSLSIKAFGYGGAEDVARAAWEHAAAQTASSIAAIVERSKA
jgi:hypothetical protein